MNNKKIRPETIEKLPTKTIGAMISSLLKLRLLVKNGNKHTTKCEVIIKMASNAITNLLLGINKDLNRSNSNSYRKIQPLIDASVNRLLKIINNSTKINVAFIFMVFLYRTKIETSNPQNF